MRESARSAHVALDLIAEPPHQLRESIDPALLRELADDIARRGLLNRIRLHKDAQRGGFYICSGHRRFLAARLLGWADIPADIAPRCADCTDGALAENIQRADLTPIEEARALAALLTAGQDAAALAHMCRKSESWVSARLALLDLPADMQDAVHRFKLPISVAHCLAQIDHAAYREYLTRDAIANGATVRTVSAWVQHYLAERPRIIANTETVESIAAKRGDYRIMCPCDYCGTPAQLEHTRAWRLCPDCDRGLREATAKAAQP